MGLLCEEITLLEDFHHRGSHATERTKLNSSCESTDGTLQGEILREKLR